MSIYLNVYIYIYAVEKVIFIRSSFGKQNSYKHMRLCFPIDVAHIWGFSGHVRVRTDTYLCKYVHVRICLLALVRSNIVLRNFIK